MTSAHFRATASLELPVEHPAGWRAGAQQAMCQAALDFTEPPVRHVAYTLDCTDRDGRPNQVLVIEVEASEEVHRNRKQECYLRVGDETRRLGPQEAQELAFDKGEAVFDGTVVRDLTLDDLDVDAIQQYAQRLGTSNIPALLRSRGLYVESARRSGVTQAGWLLFGKVPPVWSYVRYLRYLGTKAETGVRSNLTEDIRMDGNIPSLIEQARVLVKEKVGTVIRLAENGRFERMPLLPEFAWLEAIVNAVTHRSYSMHGDGVRVVQFDDRLEVESPGRLPGLVRVENIRRSRFARNPHIARVLAEMTGYVRELNEGVSRMFEEMERSGLPAPQYAATESSVRVTLSTQPKDAARRDRTFAAASATLGRRVEAERLQALLAGLEQGPLGTREVAQLLGVSRQTALAYLKSLQEARLVHRTSPSAHDPTARWALVEPSEPSSYAYW